MISEGGNRTGINGLVLAGGHSRRMGGEDKGLANWHGKPQRYYMADLLTLFCDKVYISCREAQVPEMDANYRTLPDTYLESGPTGGILTAMEYDKNVAWLVVACDLPFIDETTLQFLVDHRDQNKVATTFESPHDGLPEPLITIWEPSSYDILLNKLLEGFKCPRKILLNNDVLILQAPNVRALMNVNTPEEAEMAKRV